MFLQGTIVLWLTAILPQLRPPPCDQLSITNCGTPATITQLAILYTSLGLISLGAGCLMPCSMAFGADQLDHKDNPNNEKQIAFYYTKLPKAMSSIAVSMLTLVVAIGSLLSSVLIDVVDRFTSGGGKESWLATDLNKGHLDYYYWLIAGISSLNFLYFLLCIRL
ncbi:Protein NRT1/ PTR FAMILY 1.1 [Linum perenne]